MTQHKYGVIHYPENSYRDICVPDGADEVDIGSAYAWYEMDDDAIYMEVLNLNPNDYWVGYFFYNDMEGAEDACPVECNSREHLDAHWESNSGGGHYDCIRYEHRVNDDVIDTINHDFYDLYNEE